MPVNNAVAARRMAPAQPIGSLEDGRRAEATSSTAISDNSKQTFQRLFHTPLPKGVTMFHWFDDLGRLLARSGTFHFCVITTDFVVAGGVFNAAIPEVRKKALVLKTPVTVKFDQQHRPKFELGETVEGCDTAAARRSNGSLRRTLLLELKLDDDWKGKMQLRSNRIGWRLHSVTAEWTTSEGEVSQVTPVMAINVTTQLYTSQYDQEAKYILNNNPQRVTVIDLLDKPPAALDYLPKPMAYMYAEFVDTATPHDMPFIRTGSLLGTFEVKLREGIENADTYNSDFKDNILSFPVIPNDGISLQDIG